MNIVSQLHGSAKAFKHNSNLFEQFARQELPFMLLKTMATPKRDCMVPDQAEFFQTEEELRLREAYYKRADVRENGLDVMFVSCFEWDLGINYLRPVYCQ